MDTREYYGGTYPDPPEEKEQDNWDGYDEYMADIIYEEELLGNEQN